MTREETFTQNVSSLRLPLIRQYLEGRGWVRADRDYRGSLAIFNKDGTKEQVLVPMKPEFDDFVEQMTRAVSKLARSEGRSERSIVQDLLAGHMDTLRYRVVSTSASRGTLPLEHGIALLEGAKRSLLAAACTVLAPGKSYHPRMSFTPAEEFVDACELGQTEEGSFAVVLKCPLQFPEAAIDENDTPFARRTTSALFTSVVSLVNAIEQDRVDSVVNATTSPRFQLTANLCDALLKMQPDSESGSVDLSVTWAASLPNPTIDSGTVRLRSEIFSKIADIGKRLRGPTASMASYFLARVDVLSGTDIDASGQRYGEVRLSVILGEDDEVVRARVILDADKYKIADQAHMNNRYVVVQGLLNRSNRISTMTDVNLFQLASEQLNVFPSALPPKPATDIP